MSAAHGRVFDTFSCMHLGAIVNIPDSWYIGDLVGFIPSEVNFCVRRAATTIVRPSRDPLSESDV